MTVHCFEISAQCPITLLFINENYPNVNVHIYPKDFIINKYMFTVHIQLSCSADFTYLPFVMDLYTHTLSSTPQGAYISCSRLAHWDNRTTCPTRPTKYSLWVNGCLTAKTRGNSRASNRRPLGYEADALPLNHRCRQHHAHNAAWKWPFIGKCMKSCSIQFQTSISTVMPLPIRHDDLVEQTI